MKEGDEITCVSTDGSAFIGEVVSVPLGSLCQLGHLCAVCGKPALHPDHGTRGGTWKRDGISNCPNDFRVRCEQCMSANLKLPGQVIARDLDWSQPYDELMQRYRDEIVFDVM